MIADPELQKLFKAESDEHLARLDDGLLRLEKKPTDQQLLEEVFRESHSLKGAARMLGLSRIEVTAHRLESIFNAARKGDTPLTPPAIEQMNDALRELRQRVTEALSRNEQASVPPPTTLEIAVPNNPAPIDTATQPEPQPKPQSELQPVQQSVQQPSLPVSEAFHLETVRVETGKLDELLTQVGELSVIQGQTQHRLSLMEELLERWATLERNRPGMSRTYAAQQDTFTDPRRHFGDLLIRTREAFFDDNTRLQSIVQRLNDQVSCMRLLPLSALFALFPRMVHDLAKDQGKEVELVLEGGDITVDKRILEEMKDPLMHLIRNALDHGIETPSERKQTGKSPQATIRIRAVRDDANVLLEVHDDGRGLDVSAIRKEASRRDLFDQASLAEMTPEQIQQLIFTSGFSTCRYITELSGRGVGLDVVRSNVERLKGGINLQSTKGKGLSVQLRLPLSLATTRLLLASVANGLYGLPVEFVHTSCWIHPEQLFMFDGRLAILLNEDPVIVTHLSDLLDLASNKQSDMAEAKALACVVFQVGHERLGLLADDLPDEEEVVLKPLGAPLKRVRNISALAVLGSGEICVVLNPSDLLSSAYKMAFTPSSKPSISNGAEQTTTRSVLLLVEDSALIRAMEKRILEDADYEVVTAVDGVDALNQLSSRPFSAIVTDITMPNMDGLTLTERIRATPQYKDLPVILVTSLASDDDKRRGLNAGANAYISKPTFDQRVLLDTLKRLVV